jgi:penicillin amidase
MPQLIFSLVAVLGLSACALLRSPPQEIPIKERLAQLPSGLRSQLKSRNSELRFNEHLVPYIVSDNDEDAAFLLGVAQAHLRGFQLEVLRRASQGRLAERVGPFAAKIDHALRIFNFGKASPAIEASLPAETRVWMEAFVRGINARMKAEPRPFEFESLGLEFETWTLRDLITMSRLLAADVNWILWLRALGDKNPDGVWSLETGMAKDGRSWDTLRKLFVDISKSGSNSWALASRLTENGAPLMANDPHVGLLYPNLWLLYGLQSPSFKVVGLTLPGIPFVLLGRNPSGAWGGTNMRAMSTEFYDVSKLAPDAFKTREETIKVRAWPDKTIKIRETRFGPVLSDAALLKSKRAFAVKWLGHEESDEFTAFYLMNRAHNFELFHKAFETYGVSAQNFLWADVNGNIAHVLAMRKPERSGARPDLALLPAEERYLWKSVTRATGLPYRWNPSSNFLASANDRPDFAPEDLGPLFSPPDRSVRIAQLIGARKKALNVADMQAWQEDVYSAKAHAIAKLFVKHFAARALEPKRDPRQKEALDELKAWDGRFAVDSRGALAYAALEAQVVAQLADTQLLRTPLLKGSSYVREILLPAFEGWSAKKPLLSEKDIDAVLSRAVRGDLAKFRVWGDKHEETLAHVFAQLPLVGSKYLFHRSPVAGSLDSLAKRAHNVDEGETPTSYGATARHVSDLSDADANFFVLFGGQDGWLSSPASLSQLPLWKKGGRIRMPLTPALIEKQFPLKAKL